MSDAELTHCPDCNKPAYACDCPAYDGDDAMDNPVNHPNHYRGKRWECIEIIEAHGLDHFRATALAYILRASRKNGVEDLRKALWYLRRLAGSSTNIANAMYCIAGDPANAALMTGCAVADDFGIGHTTEPSYLRSAVKSIIPNTEEFTSASMLLEDVNDAIASLECHLEHLDHAAKQMVQS
jgi:hypothetical protein